MDILKELTEESLKNGNFDFAIFSAGGDTALKYALNQEMLRRRLM